MARRLWSPRKDKTGGEQAGARLRGKPLVLVAVLLLAVVVAAAYWLVLRPSDEALADPEPPEDGDVVEVAELTANVAGEELRYARLSFAAVLEEGAGANDVSERFPILKDAALSELTTMTPHELRSAEGLDALRERLTRRADETYPDGEVLRILVTELVVQ